MNKNKFKIGDEVLVIKDGGSSFTECVGRTGVIISWDEIDFETDTSKFNKSIVGRFPKLVRFNFKLTGSLSCFKDKYVRHFGDDEIILSSSKEAERIYLQKYRDVEK